MVLTGEQIRAARAMVQWRAVELAERAGVGLLTVERAERQTGPITMMRANMDAIQRTLEAAGVEFIAENAVGQGCGCGGRKANEQPSSPTPTLIAPAGQLFMWSRSRDRQGW